MESTTNDTTGYDFESVEQHWATQWHAANSGRAQRSPDRPKRYVLDMFPYPSGETHMGHVRNYTIGDVLARFYRMSGYDVLHPVGYDAFGLPAENAAMRHSISPAAWTAANIDRFDDAYARLGFSYDWDRTLRTCEPDYYRWTQWIFLRMFERGLAYRKAAAVNWCPSCHTVLANEQIVGGVCWRCSSTPEPRDLQQWFLRITQYADRLLDDMSELSWSEAVLTQQRNWIGRSEGCELAVPVEGSALAIEVFTTRPDTLWGVTFIALAPDHELAAQLAAEAGLSDAYGEFLAATRARTEIERLAVGGRPRGFDLRHTARNPITGEAVPVYAADYVLAGYGTGAVMGVPGHDVRDLDFAREYGIQVRTVVRPFDGSQPSLPYSGEGTLVDSGEFTGMSTEQAAKEIAQKLTTRGIGHTAVRFRLRDWLISRQRYWGTPIPIVHCPSCGPVAVPDEQLPVVLPEGVDYALDDTTTAPLAKAVDWVNVPCPSCGGPGKRETDTMDTFIDSSWYFMRFCDPKNTTAPFSAEAAAEWMPVDQYTGGIEHAVGHLIYARFLTKFLYDLDLLAVKEPFRRLLNQGTITLDGRAMSKSSGHNVDPSGILQVYGADALRLFVMFIGPPDHDYDWPRDQVQAVVGARRFLERVWALATGVQALGRSGDDVLDPRDPLRRTTHRLLHRIAVDYEEQRLNVVVSSLMSMQRELSAGLRNGADAAVLREGVTILLSALAPICPFVTEELWSRLVGTTSVHAEALPQPDPVLLVEQTVTLAVQVDGKVRERVQVPADITADEAARAALDAASAWLRGVEPARIIARPPKLVNIVTA
ncbi:leucine--tRNA ligase [Streptomyces sp. MI02-7b]|uniref:leucine--tRNA ligase n=1 Tax=Streptomyces sp. MI02-7b TaxID=462941 RepID=UPI0029AA52A8|nr:leucine--tRNA ligase [Streptomyces sp. MI02-7b]MDX3078386.1 leucine--tRNA ligase [Streptomyces sp. MI02-7b]